AAESSPKPRIVASGLAPCAATVLIEQDMATVATSPAAKQRIVLTLFGRQEKSGFMPPNAHKVSCGPVHAQAHWPCHMNLVQALHNCPARPSASPFRYAARPASILVSLLLKLPPRHAGVLRVSVL